MKLLTWRNLAKINISKTLMINQSLKWTLLISSFPPQSSSSALQDREDGLGSSSSAGYSPGKLHLRVRAVARRAHSSLLSFEKSDVANDASLLCPHRYVGELISDAEADVREDDSYLFDLDNKVTLFKTRLVFQFLLFFKKKRWLSGDISYAKCTQSGDI